MAVKNSDMYYAYSNNEGIKEKGTDMHSVNMRNAGLTDRNKAKTFFYAFLFGAGDAKLAKSLDCTTGQAKLTREKFMNNLPALQNLLDKLGAEWKSTAKKRLNSFNKVEYYDGIVKGLDGRPILIPSEHQILVYMLQSDEAIMMTKAYNLAWERISKKYKYGEDFGIVCWYHK